MVTWQNIKIADAGFLINLNERYDKIVKNLKKTHHYTYHYEFKFEYWRKNNLLNT